MISKSPPKKPRPDQADPPPYQPPAVIWEEKWEPVVLAASCARIPGQEPTCIAAPRS